MYTLKTIDELVKNLDQSYEFYKLCYIESIPESIYDYDEKSKKLINSPGFDWKKECNSSNGYFSLNLNMCDQPNPEYVKGEFELYAYFTSIELKDQWGDDWNDIPYEHNAEIPYDDNMVDGVRHNYDILKIPFAIREENITYKLPQDWGWGGNSSFSIEDINFGAVAWIFAYPNTNKYNNITIFAGENPYKFIEKILKINLIEDENNSNSKS